LSPVYNMVVQGVRTGAAPEKFSRPPRAVRWPLPVRNELRLFYHIVDRALIEARFNTWDIYANETDRGKIDEVQCTYYLSSTWVSRHEIRP